MGRGSDKPTLVNGVLSNVSATQVKLFKRCPRAWYYSKIEKLPQKPQGKGAELGEQCHKRMERWLLTGEDVRGPIERHGHEMIEPYVKFAPFNGGPMQIEADVAGVLKTPGGVAVNGFIDVYLPTGALLHPVVIDHKFKKDLHRWAEDEEALRDDEQFIIYGAFVAMKEPAAPGLEFRHHNHQTNARQNKPVSISATRDEVLAKFGALAKTIDYGMAANAQLGKGRATDVPARVSACSAFGGCDYEQVCPDSPRNRASANIFGLTTDSLTVKNVEPSQEKTNMGLMDQMMKAGTAPVIAEPTAPGLVISGKVPAAPFAWGARETELAKAIGPTALVITPAESVQAAKEEKAIEQAESKETSLPPEQEAFSADDPPLHTMTKGEKKAPKTRAKKADEPAGLTLLVDCFSSRAQDITPWALDLAKQLAQRYRVQDIRVAPKESDLSYGGWRAIIAAEAVKAPPTGVAYLAGSELTDPVIEALTGVATMVIRGRR